MIESEYCIFPECGRKADREEMCFLHAKHFSRNDLKEKPKSKSISIKSVKRIAEDKLYKKILKEMLAENPNCEINVIGCTKVAQGLHHKKKRSPKTLLDRKNLLRACNNCNGWVERNPIEAMKKGYSISKFVNG